MPTDAERREMARRLRELRLDPWDDAACEIAQCAGIVCCNSECHGSNETPECTMALASRLADLIEPNRGSGGRTILCAHCESASWCGCEPGDEEGGCDFEPSVTEGEPPYNLYSLYEAVLKRHPRDEYAIEDDEAEGLVDALLDICNVPGRDVIQRPQPSCDRDALLELADEIEYGAGTDDGEYDDMPGFMVAAIARQEIAYARRIREALGVDDA